MRKLLLLILLQVSIFANECYIQDEAKHKQNQQLLEKIIDEELATSKKLSERINQIGTRLLQSGFHADAYAVPKLDQHSVVAFNCFTLWEGKSRSIPLTFFVYIWPSEEYALKHLPAVYASNIHSHPIPCAFTVLQGAITQSNYEPVAAHSKVVRLIDQQTFAVGTGEIDDSESLFIHQLSNQGAKTCLTLHAYGEGSAKKVMETFRETGPEHTYHTPIGK